MTGTHDKGKTQRQGNAMMANGEAAASKDEEKEKRDKKSV